MLQKRQLLKRVADRKGNVNQIQVKVKTFIPLGARLTPEVTEPSTKPRTVLAQEIQENLQGFPHCLLLTRVGQFYEVNARFFPLLLYF